MRGVLTYSLDGNPYREESCTDEDARRRIAETAFNIGPDGLKGTITVDENTLSMEFRAAPD